MAKQRRRAARSPKPAARTKSEPVPERVEIPVTDPTEIARLERIFGFAEDEVATNATSRRRHDGVRRAPERIRSGRAGAGFGWGGAGTRPVRWSIDGGSLSGLACRSPGPARSTCAEAADVHCGIGSWGSWGGQRPGRACHWDEGHEGGAAAGGR